MKRFVLDEQFPETILESLGLGVPEAELVPLRHVDNKLRGLDDWEVLLEIHKKGDWDGLVTVDPAMLLLPQELVVIHQTRLTVVAAGSAGDDPIRAAGLLLVHLPMICKKCVKSVGQVWKLSATSKNHEKPLDLLELVAKHGKKSAKELLHEFRLPKEALAAGTPTQRKLPK